MLAEQSPVILGQSPPPSLGPQSPSGPDVPAVAGGTPAVQAPGLPPPASPARLCLESIACPASFPSLEPGLWFLDPHMRLCPRALCPPRWIHALKTHRPGWTLGISTYLSLHGRTRPVPPCGHYQNHQWVFRTNGPGLSKWTPGHSLQACISSELEHRQVMQESVPWSLPEL